MERGSKFIRCACGGQTVDEYTAAATATATAVVAIKEAAEKARSSDKIASEKCESEEKVKFRNWN